MSRRPRLSRSLVTLIVVYGLLMAPWPGLRYYIAGRFSIIGNALFGVMPHGGTPYAVFRPTMTGTRDADFEVGIPNRATGTIRWMTFNTRGFAYLPSVFFIACVVATPLTWKKRLRALCAGILLLACVAGSVIALTALYMYGEPGPNALIVLNPRLRDLIGRVLKAVMMFPMSWFVISGTVYALVTIRREELSVLSELIRMDRPAGDSGDPSRVKILGESLTATSTDVRSVRRPALSPRERRRRRIRERERRGRER